jgi:hypothetical protein
MNPSAPVDLTSFPGKELHFNVQTSPQQTSNSASVPSGQESQPALTPYTPFPSQTLPLGNSTQKTQFSQVAEQVKAHRTPVIIGAAVLVVLIILIAAFATRTRGLSAALTSCSDSVEADYVEAYESMFVLSDNGNTLTIEGLTGIDDPYTSCVMKELKMPQSVEDQIGMTRALDGTQTASWDNITAKWTFHPDDGLNMILTQS